MAKADPLGPYRAKRDFTRTTEPAPDSGPQVASDGPIFIVQKHAATRLHWDFRLEVDGVLKSWAVTRGPSLDPADKRLAVRTEDHPLSYAAFEGNIPEGEYGGGTVMLWDRGHWAPVAGKSAKDIDAGHLHFCLRGERMNGEWLLVRMAPRGKEKHENWLLRKVADGYAGQGDGLVARELTSVLTGRTMNQIATDKAGTQSLAGKSDKAFAAAMHRAEGHARATVPRRKKPKSHDVPPSFEPVQLASLVDTVPTSNAWMHEIKFDGYRLLAAVSGDDVRLYTRSGRDWTDRFGALARAFAALDLPAALIDGEAVALDRDGNPSFSALQAALKTGDDTALAYFAFDLLHLGGEDLKPLPNITRKQRLQTLLARAVPPLHVADHVIGKGEHLFHATCRAGQEGIIAKLIDAPYRNARTRNWVKIKCTRREEFVVIGWTGSPARARPFGALLLGQWQDRALVYKGKVGTGFDAQTLRDLAATMAPLARKQPPANVPAAEARNAHWIRAELVAEVAFAEFTAEGRVRHASFVGLREDKPPHEVAPEMTTGIADDAAGGPAPVSHADRVLFPETGATKGDLAAYYANIASLMLPFVAGRPLSLVRCPQGRGRQCFFQKHDSGALGEHVAHVAIAEKSGGTEDYLYITDAAGLRACVQMGTIEFHAWGAAAVDVERPDRMIFDLDPDEGLDFGEVKRAAIQIRDHLASIGLVAFAMLSGGKGIHVIVPLTPGHDWETHKDFSHRFAQAMASAEPDRFVATMSKAKRKGRIFIDYLRNQRGSTAVVPYSARARSGAPVAVPIAWDELADIADAHAFSIGDAAKLLQRAQDRSLKNWGVGVQTLPEI